MSEEKIIKHAGNAVHIVENKALSWRDKIKELVEEILIIIVAVSITLAFHNWNDWRNERKIEREFLEGASSDLKQEANAIGDLSAEKGISEYYDKVWEQMKAKKIDKAYVDTNSFQLVNTAYLTFDNGRFEGFKSSGYLRLIENKDLLKHLTYLYITEIPFEINADVMFYTERRNGYNTYISSKAPMDDNMVVHVSDVLNDPGARYQIAFYSNYWHERISHKQRLVKKMREVAAEIDKELKGS